MSRSPFLRTIVMSQGTYGVSHTRVPTESRPGHVALIAGFYEDVSAVTRGWKTNPVEFDSVFNQSRKTWSFGSPDILPMFAEGASEKDKVEMFMYAAEDEDYGEKDASTLDTWVFDKVEEFLKGSVADPELDKLLREDRVIFFLHLLGLDTNGHAHRPYSKEYLNNIRIVDDGIRLFVQRLESFYNHDGQTAYIFSADHGMHNRGNHGDGDPSNTETPLIAWGAGVAKPMRGVGETAWGLDGIVRHDVRQADVAPLMSTLIGVPYPMNSVGELPIPYLSNTEHYKATAAFGNARQILAQFLVKERSKRRVELHFVPYRGLLDHERRVKEIEAMIEADRIEDAERASLELSKLCIEGLRYYQTYDWLFLRGIISTGYAGWIVYSLVVMIKAYGRLDVKDDTSGNWMINAVAVLATSGFSTLLYFKDSPPNYYLYILFLVHLWAAAFRERRYPIRALQLAASREGGWFPTLLKGLAYVLGLEVLVYSYFSREILTPSLLLAGIVWPFTIPADFRKRNSGVVWLWRAACCCTSVFTVLPVEKGEDIGLVTAGGVLILLSGVVAAWLLPAYLPALPKTGVTATGPTKLPPMVILFQLAVITTSIVIVNDTSGRLRRKEGLPPLNQILSWIMLASSVVIPVMDVVKEGQHYLRRIIVIYLAFAPVFILLSISYEALFYFCFSQLLLGWMLMERQMYSEFKSHHPLSTDYKEVTSKKVGSATTQPKFRPLTSDDLRIATVFLFLVNVAFFGTGNIASVSSFSLESVYRFTTIFDPFLMGALLLTKIWVPFFLLSAVLGVVSRSLDLPAFSLFLLVLSTTDVMTLNFFFLVRDDGSWLEIGTTISHFIIASTFIVFQIVLFCMGHLLVGKVLIPEVMEKRGAKKLK
ncbi:Glycosyl phosphatidyl inositol anchor synthesis [Irineochytrium annulatum]|nr:Glycosyl phosphatidyl inositol anchor synthesis [Irineochytrium annulatum]